MDILTILGWFLVVWGVSTLLVAVLKPAAVWKLGKIQGFVQLLTEKGTVIFFGIVGAAAVLGGILLLV